MKSGYICWRCCCSYRDQSGWRWKPAVWNTVLTGHGHWRYERLLAKWFGRCWPCFHWANYWRCIRRYWQILNMLRWLYLWSWGWINRDPVWPIAGPRSIDQIRILLELVAGLLVIIGNPKVISFKIGVLPRFLDMTQVTALDVAVVVLVSATILFCGHNILAIMIDRANLLIAFQSVRGSLNVITGVVLFILDGLALIM